MGGSQPRAAASTGSSMRDRSRGRKRRRTRGSHPIAKHPIATKTPCLLAPPCVCGADKGRLRLLATVVSTPPWQTAGPSPSLPTARVRPCLPSHVHGSPPPPHLWSSNSGESAFGCSHPWCSTAPHSPRPRAVAANMGEGSSNTARGGAFDWLEPARLAPACCGLGQSRNSVVNTRIHCGGPARAAGHGLRCWPWQLGRRERGKRARMGPT